MFTNLCLYYYVSCLFTVFYLFFVYIFSDIEEYEKRIKVLEQECAEMKAAGKTEFGIGKLRKKYFFLELLRVDN